MQLWLKQKAKEHGFSQSKKGTLQDLVRKHKSVFCTTFSGGPPAAVKVIKVDLVSDPRLVRVKLRNYSKLQKEYLKTMVEDPKRCGILYPNPTSTWACAPLLVPNGGLSRFYFTVDL